MKTILKIGGAIFICMILLLATLRATGFEPRDCANASASWSCRAPGLWLKGELVTTPVADWSFTDKVQNIEIQTNSWYLLPHSVTINCISHKGQLYLYSFYAAGLTYPHGRRWNEDVARDPHVRIKIGDKLYDRTLVYLTDPDERAAIIQNKRKKYPQQIIKPGSYINIFHVVSNDEHVPD